MTQKEFIEILKKKGYSYKFDGDRLIVTHEGYVDLERLTSLPENTCFKNRGWVDLESLTSLSENITFENQGNVDLDSLTSMPENTTFKNKGGVYLDSLTSMPENTCFINEGGVGLENLTSLPESTCFKNKGGVGLENLTSLPESTCFKNKGSVYLEYLVGKHMYQGKEYEFLYIDYRTMIILSRKKVQEYTILKTKYFGGGEIGALETVYIAQKGEYSAHGTSIKQAIEDVNFKHLQENFDLDELVHEIKKSERVTKRDYRLLTGACDAGVEHFKAQNSIDREYLTIEEVLKLTQNEFGGSKFRELFT